MISKYKLVSAAALALFAAAGTARADIVVYTSLAAFQAAVGQTGTDTFAGMSTTGTTASPLARTAGAFGYTATATRSTGAADSFFAGGTAADPFLSTLVSGDTITLGSFTGGVVGVGGNFFGSDTNGTFTATNGVIVTATDASGTVTQTLLPTGMLQGSFLGFVSTTGMTSVTVKSNFAGATVATWPSVDNLVLANAVAAVPEPASYAMLLAGLGLAGAAVRRRRASEL